MRIRIHRPVNKSSTPINTTLVAKQQKKQPVNHPKLDAPDPKFNFDLSKILFSSPNRASSPPPTINPKSDNKTLQNNTYQKDRLIQLKEEPWDWWESEDEWHEQSRDEEAEKRVAEKELNKPRKKGDSIISASVGQGGANRHLDVRIVQNLLKDNQAVIQMSLPKPTGEIDATTIQAIKEYQRLALGFKKPDGRVDPNGKTIINLQQKESKPETETKTIVTEQEIRDQAGIIQDKYVKLMIYYGGALDIFKTVLEAPSAIELQPNFGKVLLDYVSDKVIGKIVSKVPGADYIYDIYKKIRDENKRAAKARNVKDLSQFFVEHKIWITETYGELEGNETDYKIEAARIYQNLPTHKEQLKYFRELKLKADNLKNHSKSIDTYSVFQIFVEKWLQRTTPPSHPELGSSYLEIRLDKNWKITKAHIHSPGGAQIAEEFNKKSINPLNLKARKLIFSDKHYISKYQSNSAMLSKNNKFLANNRDVFNEIMNKGIPIPSNWSGD